MKHTEAPWPFGDDVFGYEEPDWDEHAAVDAQARQETDEEAILDELSPHIDHAMESYIEPLLDRIADPERRDARRLRARALMEQRALRHVMEGGSVGAEFVRTLTAGIDATGDDEPPF